MGFAFRATDKQELRSMKLLSANLLSVKLLSK